MKAEIVQLARRAVPKTRLGIGAVVAGVLIVSVTAVGVAAAAIPTKTGVIHGCYATAAATNGTHALTVINPTTTAKCPTAFTGLSWNVDGSNGYSTQTSDTHLNDTLTQVAEITLPTGSYLINANAWLEDDSPSNSSSLGVCELTFGSATDEVEAGLAGPSSAPLNDQTLNMSVAATVTSSSDATLSCEAVGDSGLTYADSGSMTAAEVGSLNP